MTSQNCNRLLLAILSVVVVGSLLVGTAAAFAPASTTPTTPRTSGEQQRHRNPAFLSTALSLSTKSGTSSADLKESIASNLEVLNRAATTKTEDPDAVYGALFDLEKQMRALAKDDPSVAKDMLKNLDGDWRLVFTTGTKNTQDKLGGGRINYFPLKAVQSFRTVGEDPMLIENGIYVGDFPLIKFRGTMEFDLRKRKLEFDFDHVGVLNFFDVSLGKGEAAKLGAKSGLGSEGNAKLSEKDKSAFFNWISADENIATARGGGGGLALWKRVVEEE